MGRLWGDEALAQKLGDAAARRFQALFTADRMVEKYVDLYRRLTNRT
jgi:rhamnosyl/mannosyltransferase